LKDLPEDTVDLGCMAHDQHMTRFGNRVAGVGEPYREYFVPGAMYVPERLGNILVTPIQDGVNGPFNKPGIPIPDHLPEQFFIGCFFTGE
jgi:hypothetical protein